MPLFRICGDQKVEQIKTQAFSRERSLQRLIEKNLNTLLGIRFVASEFPTGDRQRGRIDTLGLDQDGTPVIIEYKKTSNENVINQGLFYLDWLLDHKGDFTVQVQRALGKDCQIDWSNPRLILIAENFSEYDKYAVNRIGSNIELWIYRLYGEDLLYMEPMNSVSPTKSRSTAPEGKPNNQDQSSGGTRNMIEYSVENHLQGKSPEIIDLFKQLQERIFSLGEDINEKAVKHYVVYKHGKNFCEVWIQNEKIKIWLDIAPDVLNDPLHLARDVTKVGHWGTGDVEINLENDAQLEPVFDLIRQSYQQTV
ncbi:DUF5655 domain-containing protein [Bellilinea sp.]|uniref:DUF5655 domain-containing protein n=1 Tax=Bellilinea sp. TaxID=2838785 RepID=UPI0021DE2850|nr:DUF5655 domain-containing protein [Bellilinea sp.]GIV64891.1 MAG: hypothetical protein KatS3mg046_151 [Bellilinea sp.]